MDQPSLFPAGRSGHGGLDHTRRAALEWKKATVLRHLRTDHGVDVLDDLDGWTALLELHQVLHGVQLELDFS